MRRTSAMTVFLLFLGMGSICHAIEIQQLSEQTRRRTRHQPRPIQEQPVVIPEHIKARQEERQRREREPSSSALGSQLSQPRIVSIERLKLHSETPVEYQLEPIQALTIQDGGNSHPEEKTMEDQSEAAVPQPEQPSEEAAGAPPIPAEPTDEAPVAQEQVSQANTEHTLLKIIEENNRIIVIQVEPSLAIDNPVQ